MAELLSAGLGAAVGELLSVVLDATNKAIQFRSILKGLESTLKSIEPVFAEVEKLNKVLDRPVQETQMFTDHLKKAKKTVSKCSEIRWWKYYKTPFYAEKLIELDGEILKFFQIEVQGQLIVGTKRIEVKVDEIGAKLNGLGLRVMKGSVITGPCGVPGILEFIVGFDVHLQELKMRLLKDGVQVVVLSAPGGCGKTTLANMLCHDVEIKGIFTNNIFFVTVSKTPTLRVIVQNMFIHKSFSVPEFQNDDDAINQLEILLKQIGPDPVLLVLDDVWSGSESLIQKFMFRIPGYKILVTSRSEFPRFNSSYKLDLLSDRDAMALFCYSAFLQGESMNMPEDLVQEIVRGCSGFPLALTVVGRSLCGQPEFIWRRTLKQWSEGQSIFDSNSDSNNDLLIRLKTSIDALDEKTNVKECFLDLCSFPQDQRIPAMALMDMWVELYNLDENGVYANIYELDSRNLVNLVFTRKDASEIDGYYNEHFVMLHNPLRDLAIHQSSQKRIEQRKRLIIDIRGNDLSKWSIEQIQPFHACLLSISTDETFSSSWYNMQLPEVPEVEVLILNFRTRNYSLPEFIEKLDQLKVLIITNYGLCPAELSNFQLFGLLPSLKRIRLEHVSISFLCESTYQFRNLQKMSLNMCKIGETFRNCTSKIAYMFPNLVEIDIHCCSDLVVFPEELCDIMCLKKLSITKCNDLDALPQRLGKLTNLEVLRLHSCTGLMGLPESVGNLHKLRFLDISDCLTISELPIQLGQLCGLKRLDMRGCELRQLPPSVKDLGQLKYVICDEDNINLWEPFKIHLNNLKIIVLKEDKNLNWLPNLPH